MLLEEELGALLSAADVLVEGQEGAMLSAVLRWMWPPWVEEPRGKSLLKMPSFKRICNACLRVIQAMGEDVPMVEGLQGLLCVVSVRGCCSRLAWDDWSGCVGWAALSSRTGGD
jgi:hypothetical protein